MNWERIRSKDLPLARSIHLLKAQGAQRRDQFMVNRLQTKFSWFLTSHS